MNNKEKKDTKIKQFRLRGKKLFLTYPQLNSSIEFIKEEALEQLKLKIKHIESYLIGAEKHEDGGVHIHCFFELKTAFETKSVNYLDLQFENVEYHGNYQIGKRKNALIEYIIKDGNFITNMTLPVKNGKLLSADEHLFNVCVEEGYHKAKDVLYETYPSIATRRGSTIMKNLASLSEHLIQKESEEIKNENIFQIKDFDKLSKEKAIEIMEWVKNGIFSGFNITLVFHGPGGTGKTMLAKSIFKALNIEPLIVSEINDFKKYDSSKHKGILIDDLDAESLSRLETLNIIDSYDGKTIRVLYGIVSPIPAIPRIITTNRLNDFTKKGANELIRRLKDIYIPERISSKFNIQINIQNNYFFGDSLGVSKDKLEEVLSKFNELTEKASKKKELDFDFDLNK